MNYDSVLGYFQGDSIVHANGRYKLDLTCHCTDVCDFYFQQTQLMKILNNHSFHLVMILKFKNGQVAQWVQISFDFVFDFCTPFLDTIDHSSHVLFLILVLRKYKKYYIIFVYILQGKMGMTEKKERKSRN